MHAPSLTKEPTARVIHYPNVPDTIGVRIDKDYAVEYRLTIAEASELAIRVLAAIKAAQDSTHI